MITNDTHKFLPSSMTNNREMLHEVTLSEQELEVTDEYQPIIGIPVPVQQGNQGPLLQADAVGAWAVERMRGRILLLPLWPFPAHKHVYQSLWSLTQSIDGLFLPAGILGTDWSLHWKESDNQPSPDGWATSWEIALAQLATYIGMPILAVADGAEKWNSALGGKRGEIIRTSKKTIPMTPDTWDRHTLRVRTKSSLAFYLQSATAMEDGEQKPWELAFMPDQGVEKLAPGLRSCAQSEDASVVAFERRDGAFGLGILGRLDWSLDQAYGKTLFNAFLHACRSFDHTRQQNNAWKSSRDTICTTVSECVTRGQPLISVPGTSREEKQQHPNHFSDSFVPVSSTVPTGQQERLRQRSRPLTKEELNQMRRQRLKTATR